jgi:hypothetical protein
MSYKGMKIFDKLVPEPTKIDFLRNTVKKEPTMKKFFSHHPKNCISLSHKYKETALKKNKKKMKIYPQQYSDFVFCYWLHDKISYKSGYKMNCKITKTKQKIFSLFTLIYMTQNMYRYNYRNEKNTGRRYQML